MVMSVPPAQRDMREGYCSGAAGILASALAWSAAAAVAILDSAHNAVLALLIGGVLIHPLAVLICRLLGARGTHTQGNPLGQLAAASTFWLIFCLPLAYGLSLQALDWFFPAMLLIIGGRYLAFATLYGLRLYWALGLSLAAAGVALAYLAAPADVGALTGAVLELLFAIVFLAQHRRRVCTHKEYRPTPSGSQAQSGKACGMSRGRSSLLKKILLALALTYASLLVSSRSAWQFDTMGCETECIVKSAGWPVPYFYDYPGMSVGNRVEVDPLSLFIGPDKFRLSGFVPTLLFWLLAVHWLAWALKKRADWGC